MDYLFTSEAVTEGHPDKMCDKISDKILDCALKEDKSSKMAIEATIKDDLVLIYGEAKTNAKLNYENIVKEVLKDIGYNERFTIITKISEQSNEINRAVDKKKICAGDQGIMFGYACDETKELMPLPIMLANKLAYRLTECRKSNEIGWLLPDGKTQVTVRYVENSPVIVEKIIIACQHMQGITNDMIRQTIIEKVIKKVIPPNLMDENTQFMINTSGSFTIGGPFADSGTTGRKIVCDTYGGMGRIGGGCLSSKDPSKVDRSGAYYARYVAKNIVYNGLSKKCEIQVSYAIGVEKPISIYIETFGTNKVEISKIYEYVEKYFNFSVSNIIKELDLYNQSYYDTACYGHFGKECYSWEKIKNVENLN